MTAISPKSMLRTIAVFAVLTTTACSTSAPSVETVRLLTHDGFVIPTDTLEAYTERTGVRVAVLRESDPAAVVDLLSRTRDQPVADVVLGIDSLSLNRVISEGLVTPYRAIEADKLDPLLMVDDDRLTPVSTLDVCVNVDAEVYRPEPPDPEELERIEQAKAALPEGAELAVPEDENPEISTAPTSIQDLTLAQFGSQFVVPDPNRDQLGQYFMVSLWQHFGDDPTSANSWTAVLRDLYANDMLIAPSWRDAYFGEFTQGNSSGTRTAVVASAGMPVVTARLRHTTPELLETEALVDECLRVVSYAGIVQGAADRRTAGRLIDTMISPEFQFFLGDSLGSRPARADLIISELDELYAQTVEAEALDPSVDQELIAFLLAQWNAVIDDFDAAPEDTDDGVLTTLPDP
ncbi:MAG: solute-binding protein [Actinomycetia bacterium]|nr:solute-binding protein [Actinomycetes bacterium]